MQDLKHIVTKS